MNFNFKVSLDDPVDGATMKAFSGLLLSTKKALACIAADQKSWKTRVDDVSKDNEALRQENANLKAEVARLTAQQNTAPSTGGETMNGVGRTVEPPLVEKKDPFELERSIKIHDAPVHGVAIGPNSDIVATASWDASIKLYNPVAKEVFRTLGPYRDDSGLHKMGGLYAAAFAKKHPDILACTSCDKCVYLWNHNSGEFLKKFTGHQHEVNDVDFHSFQQIMCTASDDGTAIIWDYQEGFMLRTLEQHKKEVYGATFLGQENEFCVATCCFDTKIRIFDMRDKKVVATLGQHADSVIGIDYATSKTCLATGSDDGWICIWDARTWKLQCQMDTKHLQGTDEFGVKRVAFSPDGKCLAAACSSGSVFVYDMNNYALKADLGGHTDCAFDVAWGACPTTKARILVSASHDHTCRYWRENSYASNSDREVAV